MSWENNVYYYPEKHGLEVIGELNDPEACYSFYDLIVWRHSETGKVYYAIDSGCSCPSPFEEYTSIDDLTEITDENWVEFMADVKEHCTPYDYDRSANAESRIKYNYGADPQAVDKVELIQKVSQLMVWNNV